MLNYAAVDHGGDDMPEGFGAGMLTYAKPLFMFTTSNRGYCRSCCACRRGRWRVSRDGNPQKKRGAAKKASNRAATRCRQTRQKKIEGNSSENFQSLFPFMPRWLCSATKLLRAQVCRHGPRGWCQGWTGRRRRYRPRHVRACLRGRVIARQYRIAFLLPPKLLVCLRRGCIETPDNQTRSPFRP